MRRLVPAAGRRPLPPRRLWAPPKATCCFLSHRHNTAHSLENGAAPGAQQPRRVSVIVGVPSPCPGARSGPCGAVLRRSFPAVPSRPLAVRLHAVAALRVPALLLVRLAIPHVLLGLLRVWPHPSGRLDVPLLPWSCCHSLCTPAVRCWARAGLGGAFVLWDGNSSRFGTCC